MMNRGRRRERIFQDTRDYEVFLEVLKKTSEMFGIEIHAYALMPNHYHLLLCTPEGNISRAMRHINGVYTQKYNKRHKIDGGLFRGRYKSTLVEKEEYLLELVRYIHRNAYKARLEEKIGEYEWDSHREYMREKAKQEWLIKEEVLRRFGKYEKEARRELDAFVRKEVSKDLLKRLESVNWPVVLGGKEFKRKVKEWLRGREIKTGEITGYKRYERDKEKMEENIKKILENKKEEMEKKRSRKYSEERRAIIYLLRMNGKSLKETGEYMGGITYVTVSKQYKQAEEEIKKKKGCYKHYKEMLGVVKFKR